MKKIFNLLTVSIYIFLSFSMVLSQGLSKQDMERLNKISSEEEFWGVVESIDKITGYFAYLQKFSNHKEKALTKIKALANNLKPITSEKEKQIKNNIVTSIGAGTNIKLKFQCINWLKWTENSVIRNGWILLSPKPSVENFSELLGEGTEIKFLDKPDTIFIFYNRKIWILEN